MAAKKNGAPGTQERRLMESESRWLQKALFALSKAEGDREKLEAVSEDGVEPIKVRIRGKSVDLGAVLSAMDDAVRERAEDLRESLQGQRPILR